MRTTKRIGRGKALRSLIRGIGFEPLEMRAVPATISGKFFHDWNGDGNPGSIGEPGLAGWTAWVDLDNDGLITGPSGGTDFSSGTVNIPIPDNNPTGITSDIVISGSGLGLVTDVNVTININHTFVADLDIFLRYNGGTPVELTTDNGSSGDNFTGTVFDDQASRSITSIVVAEAPFTGRFRPEGLLSTYNGFSVDGTWTLFVVDDAGADLGTLVEWSINFNGILPEPAAVSDANGNFTLGSVPVGTYNMRMEPQAGWSIVAPSGGVHLVTISGAGDTLTGFNFALARPDAIYGTVFEDSNGSNAFEDSDTRLANRLVYQDANTNGVFDQAPGGTAFTSGTINLAIPDNNLTGISSNIVISGSGLGFATDISIRFTILHTNLADIDVFLSYNGGTPIELTTDNGGTGDDYIDTMLDDSAATLVTAGTAPFSGIYRPEQLLSTLATGPVDGTWTLRVADDAAGNAGGVLVYWTIIFNGGPPETSTVSDANGNYVFLSQPPGTYQIRHIPAPGFTTTVPASGFYNVNLTAGDTSFGNSFGVVLPNSINGSVYNDLNNSGSRDGGEPGIVDRFAYLDLNNNGVWDTNGYVSSPNMYIPDSPNPAVTNSIVVAGSGIASITDLNVMINIRHTFVGDLEIRLSKDGGTQFLIVNRRGSSGDDFFYTVLDDEATRTIAAVTATDAPFYGSFQPESTALLSNFDGLAADGVWTLSVRDAAGGDIGLLVDWALFFNDAVPEPVAKTNASGNFQFTGLAAGTYMVRNLTPSGWIQTEPAGGGGYSVTLTGSNASYGNNFGTFDNTDPFIIDIVDVSPDPRNSSVATIDVILNERVNLASFTFADLTLTRDGGSNLATATITIAQGGGTVYRINGLSGFTGVNGVYELTVFMAGITDLQGRSGSGSANEIWTRETTPPTVVDVVDVAPDPRATPVNEIDVVFSELINLATFTVADISLTRNSSPVTFSGNETFTFVSGTTYRVGGLAEETAADGVYVFTVNGAGIADIAGNTGATSSASDTWTKDASDTTPPTVTALFFDGSAWTPTFRGAAGDATYGYPAQTGAGQLTTLPWNNLNRFTVQFSEALSTALTTSDVEVLGTNAGTIAGLTITQLDSLTYRITLPANATTDFYLFRIFSANVEDAAGNKLAGTFTEGVSTFPTGGSANVNFVYRFRVAVGDADRNGIVRNPDVNLVRANLFNDFPSGTYSIYFDVTGDGQIRNADVNAVRANLFNDPPGTGPSRPVRGGQPFNGDANGSSPLPGNRASGRITSRTAAIERDVATTRRISAVSVVDAIDALLAEF